jgi:hypothetical protein
MKLLENSQKVFDETIPLNKLIKKNADTIFSLKISPDHLFYVFKNTKSILVHRAGDLLIGQDLDKYFSEEKPFLYAYQIVNAEHQLIFKKLFAYFSLEHDENQRHLARIKYLQYVCDIYWSGEKEGSLLDFSYAHFSMFCDLEDEILTKIRDKSILLFNRALMISSWATCLAIAGGVCDLEYLKKFYTTSFLIDFGLVDPELSFDMLTALEFDRCIPGKGERYLAKSNFLVHFHNIRERSYQKSKNLMGVDQVLLKTIAVLSNYSKLNISWFNGPESILLFLNSTIPYKEIGFLSGDGQFFLKDLLESFKQNKYLQYMPHGKIESLFSFFIESDVKKKEFHSNSKAG